MEQTTSTATTDGKKDTCCGTPPLWHSSRIHSALSLVLILLAAFLFAQTINALKEYKFIGSGISASNAISVSGEGEAFAVPDMTEFTFTVMEEAATASEVQQKGTEKVDGIIAAVKEQGIEEKDIKTVGYMVTPKYEWQQVTCVRYPCDRQQVQTGFTLEQSVQVKVRDMNKAGSLVTLATEKGASSVSGLSFTIADEDAVQAEARKEAIDQARAKADQLAKDLGVQLVRIVGFYEEQGGYPMPYMSMAMGKGGDEMMEEEAAPAVLPAGENQYVSRVNITYEVR